ncbi:hypothetical protein N8T08_004600 [Aspergillus melleus]|uniref:Uncharacterized protein n=1 Tax=Aspergillus melleus TaxID=138277 RepID=A0ACC3B4Q5_9EURO|nr:hypothetical protein N8T08_004600 [Aspergillus melleus]
MSTVSSILTHTPTALEEEGHNSVADGIYYADNIPTNTIIIHKGFCNGSYALSLVPQTLREISMRIYKKDDNLTYPEVYVILMKMCRRDTLDGLVGKVVYRMLEKIIQDSWSGSSYDAKFAQIAVHLERRVVVRQLPGGDNSRLDAVLEDFYPVYSNDGKFLEIWTVEGSYYGYRGSFSRSGTLDELMYVLDLDLPGW